MQVASALKRICDRLGIFYIFKASYDKANRTSARSFRGPGLDEGLAVLSKVRARVGVPILTDIHTETQAVAAARVADLLQIPAFLCRQTDLVAAAVRTGKRPDGSAVSTVMPFPSLANINDTDAEALYLFIESLSPRRAGER